MNDKDSKNNIGRLKENLLATSHEEIAEVIKEAQREAIKEAKAILKERMLEAILQDAMGKVNRLTSEPAILIVDEKTE